MLLGDLRAQTAYYAKNMYDSRLVRATQGNLSVRDQQSGLICVTPSSIDYQTMTAEDIVVVDGEGSIVEGQRRPTSELALHISILQQRPDIHCVMHTHSPYATAFGVIGAPIPVVLADSALYLGGEVPVAPYRRSGTPEFAKLIAATLGQGYAVIWGNHGAMVVGKTLALAFSAAHALEDTAQVYILAKQLGLGTPILLAQKDIDDLWFNK